MGTELTEKQIQKAILTAIKAKKIERSSEEDLGIDLDANEDDKFRGLRSILEKNMDKKKSWRERMTEEPKTASHLVDSLIYSLGDKRE